MGEIRSVGGRLKGRINGRHLNTTVTVVSLSEANINVISRVAKKKKAETLRPRTVSPVDWTGCARLHVRLGFANYGAQMILSRCHARCIQAQVCEMALLDNNRESRPVY